MATLFGMKGKKLVSDYLTDRKKNFFEKQSQLVLEDAKGQIIWVVGERTSELCKIKEDTKKILYIQVSQVREVKDLKGDSEITSR